MAPKGITSLTLALLGAAACLMLAGCGGGGATCSGYLGLDDGGKADAIMAAHPKVFEAYGDSAKVFAKSEIPQYDEFCSRSENSNVRLRDTTVSVR